MTTVPEYSGSVPSRTQAQTTFNTNVNAILAYIGGTGSSDFIPSLNTVVSEVDANRVLAENAAASFSATEYSGATTYGFPDSVIGSDGNTYRCLGTSVTGDDPVGSVTGDWLRITYTTGAATETYPGIVEKATTAEAAAGTAEKYIDAELMQAELVLLSPPGAVSAFAMNAAPSGWLKANGATVSRTTYADLFAAIGTTFGAGDGSTTFEIPDLRGEFVRGWDDSRGVDSGRSFGSAQSDALESHNHSYTRTNAVANDAAQGTLTMDGFSLSSVNTGSTGAASETRPRNIALLYCIKY